MTRIDQILTAIKPYVLGWIESAGSIPGAYDHGALAGLGDDDHAQYVHVDAARTITAVHTFNPTSVGSPFAIGANANGQLVSGLNADLLDGYHASAFATAGHTHSYVPTTRQVIAGNGLTGGGALSADVTLNVVAADTSLSVAADAIGVNLASASGLQISSGLQIADSIAGAGLTISNKVLSVGAGAGITVNADDVALTTPGGLSVSSTNSATGNHTHAIASSNNPGAAASLLASDASGALQLTSLTLSTALTTPRVTATANLTIDPTGDVIFNPAGKDILPAANYDLNIGALSKKYLTLHAAELWVETLVAQGTIATIGGRILVGPTTTLVSDLSAGATTMVVKHNSLANGDIVYLEVNGVVEFIAVASAPGGSGPYTYTVTRDLNGKGSKQWYAGDAVFNTGQTGSGFIDLYSVRGMKGASQAGPTIVGNVRNSATYNDWTEHWALGNLNGLYGYGATTYGVAVGKYSTSTSWLSADATNGIRIMRGSTQLAQWDISGNILIGQAAPSQDNIYISSGAISIRNNTTERIGLTAAGILTIKDSAGNAVFTLDASAGAEFTKALTLGANGGIYQGSGTFASPTTGLKIWNDSGVGRIAGYNGGTPQWYASTDGKLYAGGGNVVLDSNGVTILAQTTYNRASALTIYNGSAGRITSEIYSTITSPVDEMFIKSTSGSGTGWGSRINILAQGGGTAQGYGEIRLYTASSITPAKGLKIFSANSNVVTTTINSDYFNVNCGLNVGSATGAETGQVFTSGSVFVNDTSNSFMTSGITINQGGADDEILTFKSTDVSHGFTSNTEADTYGRFLKNNATNGGLIVDGFGTGSVGLRLGGAAHSGDTTKSNTSSGRVSIDGWGISGSTRGGIGSNENIVAFRNGTTTRFILDGDGDSHQDVGTAWTNFDAHNDVELLTALSVQVSRESDPIRASFNMFLAYNRRRLEDLKLVTFNENGHHFVNMSRLAMLLVGAVRQLDQRLARLEDNH